MIPRVPQREGKGLFPKRGKMRGEKFEQLSGQKTFASCGGWDCRRKVTRRHLFLQTIRQVMPWQTLLELVEPLGDKANVGQEATIRQKTPKVRSGILQRACRSSPSRLRCNVWATIGKGLTRMQRKQW